MLNKKCIIRCDRSGVFFGTLVSLQGQTAELLNVRKIWYWEDANAVEQVANDGVSTNSKLTVMVDSIIVTDAIQVLPCTDKAITNLESIKEWKR